MQLKYLITLIGLSCAYGDCDFIISNYTNAPVTATAGFYGSSESRTLIQPATTTTMRVISNYQCNDTTAYGSGRVYIAFPNDANGTGVNYSPLTANINFMGKFSGDPSGRTLRADNGLQIWLTSDGRAISDKQVEVQLKFAQRPNSKVAGTP